MSRLPKILFFGLIVKPIVLIVLGLNIRNYNKLPIRGPALIAANHNSHLDTMVLMSLYPLSRIHKVRPVAAADYFMTNRLLAWFALNVIGIIPITRSGEVDREHLFDGCNEALDQGDILVLFPEGSRGKPEQIGSLKKGIYHLLKQREDTEITPVVLHGLGRALPKGEALLVPFNCDVIVGDKLPKINSADDLVQCLSAVYEKLLQHCLTRNTAG
ncbi:MAG TPA: 1-acyl-sn-glycerol-3-phosphate acyltransferase [Acidiferrobacteraceae bacterium]|nr:1-acyl-sn-glycerol-3-phosphate acyltransferase [Acidiferrobacteraceae bacterium]HEX19769.1 1-acyl-sn-glycerol-3-phosphate acyltransferase [Acidiferrobacteraceae bacterium]